MVTSTKQCFIKNHSAVSTHSHPQLRQTKSVNSPPSGFKLQVHICSLWHSCSPHLQSTRQVSQHKTAWSCSMRGKHDWLLPQGIVLHVECLAGRSANSNLPSTNLWNVFGVGMFLDRIRGCLGNATHALLVFHTASKLEEAFLTPPSTPVNITP